MNFGADHYVPVLKVKRGEKTALRLIAPAIQPRITPLMEIVKRTNKTKSDHLDTGFNHLAESIQPYSRCFLDVQEMASDGPEAAEEIFRRATAEGIVFTPVTGISNRVDTAAALMYNAHGTAIRLIRKDFENGTLSRSLQNFMNDHGLTPAETDLIVDLGPVENMIVPGVTALTRAFLAAVPNHDQWRTFTLSGCAFPISMGVVERHSHKLIQRSEWISWRDYMHAQRGSLSRLPTFSDCVIQHPAGVEGFDFRIHQSSATIRYTLDNRWLLIKGVGTRKKLPSEQFPDLAIQLIYGHLNTYFFGKYHCEGCSGIQEAADGMPRLGSLEVWRRLGTIHHITTVVQGLAALTFP